MASAKLVLQPAILGSLIQRPTYAYALYSHLSLALRGVVYIPKAGVYAQIDELRGSGDIEWNGDVTRSAGGRMESKHYRTTPQGERAFQAWLAQPRQPQKEEALDYIRLRLRIAPELSPERIQALMRSWRQDLLESSTSGLPDEVADLGRLTDHGLRVRLSQELDMLEADAQLRFVESAMELTDAVANARARRRRR